MKPQYNNIIISYSFDNYMLQSGGTDKAICKLKKMFFDNGISYVHIAPTGLAHIKYLKRRYYTIGIDDKLYKVGTYEDVINYIYELIKKRYNIEATLIHHTNGFLLKELEDFIRIESSPIFYYIHDFHTVCDSINLLKDGERYCNTNIKEYRESCADCRYGKDLEARFEKYNTFFRKFENRISFIFPSNSTREIWRVYYPYIKKETCYVVPHNEKIGEYIKFNIDYSKIRIAYIGAMHKIKGKGLWDKIVNLVDNEEYRSTYQLYYFGSSEYENKNVIHIDARLDIHGESRMTSLLRKNNIQIVVLFSNCPETYSYTYEEATAANAFILTSDISGNIADSVRKHRNGMVFNQEEQVLFWLQDPQTVVKELGEFASRRYYGPERYEQNDEILSIIKEQKSVEKTVNREINKLNKKFDIRDLIMNINYRIKYRDKII